MHRRPREGSEEFKTQTYGQLEKEVNLVAAGLAAIGVATGPYSVAALLANGCDHAVESLADTEMLLGLIAPRGDAEQHGLPD